ncbi:gamma-glutamylcyclotransferase family protein [Desulfonatronum thiodismutans]|uniref:gamma-glutamylcyclotransferase family protein n=1 Tax=Desulfonatronum thiodismutans TaxID=159290 RepID=UPI0004ABDA22|nr:gamma-glutamylcyclotransferase family protein [Desulfonatronum thiodismutans]
MSHLFAYGTLMCEDIMQSVSGCRLPWMSGILRGYSRKAVTHQVYPALVPDAESCVEGIVYFNVPPDAWHRLDLFEGDMYFREVVEVTLGNGEKASAQTYVAKPHYRVHLEDAAWDHEAFLSSGKMTFEREYIGFRSLP